MTHYETRRRPNTATGVFGSWRRVVGRSTTYGINEAQNFKAEFLWQVRPVGAAGNGPTTQIATTPP